MKVVFNARDLRVLPGALFKVLFNAKIGKVLKSPNVLKGDTGMSSSPMSIRSSVFWTVLQPLGAAVGAVFAFGVLVVSTRQGQFLSIASFGAGASLAALASVAVGGGTSLAYTTGDTARQRAVRAVRSVIVLPTIGLVTIVAVFVYGVLGSLDRVSIVAGGLATFASVGAELDAAYLRRYLKTGRLLITDTLNRMVTFGLVLVHVPFGIAMLSGAVARALMLWGSTRHDPSRTGTKRIGKTTLALAYEAKLTSLSILYSLCDRIGALTAPVMAPVPVVGGFMALVGAQQNAAGVLMSGVQTTLAVRSNKGAKLPWTNYADLLFVLGGLIAASVMILFKVPLIAFLGLGIESDPSQYWVPIALLVPAAVASRVLDFRFIADESARSAVVARAIATVVAVAAAVLAYAQSNLGILAVGLLLSEVASILISVIIVVLKLNKLNWRRAND